MKIKEIKKLTRAEKEELYIKAVKVLQRHWGNPILDSDFDDIKEFTDEQLVKGIIDNQSQFSFEKKWHAFGFIIYTIIKIFVVLGIIGLLVFGIKQLF